MKNKLLLVVLLAVMFLLGGCEDAETKAARERADEFLENFSVYCEGYELLDYVYGSSETYPVQLAIIAKSDSTDSSNVLIVVDDDSFGTLRFGDDYCVYREEDGLKLNENVVLFSLDIYTDTDTDYEVHDFEITVTYETYEGHEGIKYTNKETIRENN